MKKVYLLLALALIIGALTACGGGGANNEPEPVNLEFSGFDEFRYDPTSAEAPAGATVNVAFHNEGVLEHNWILVSNRDDLSTVTEEDAIGGALSGLTPAGETKTFSFTAPPPGAYKIVCSVPGHAIGGMVADFTVAP